MIRNGSVVIFPRSSLNSSTGSNPCLRSVFFLERLRPKWYFCTLYESWPSCKRTFWALRTICCTSLGTTNNSVDSLLAQYHTQFLNHDYQFSRLVYCTLSAIRYPLSLPSYQAFLTQGQSNSNFKYPFVLVCLQFTSIILACGTSYWFLHSDLNSFSSKWSMSDRQFMLKFENRSHYSETSLNEYGEPSVWFENRTTRLGRRKTIAFGWLMS